MQQLITTPDKFAAWFNAKVPGAYRRITAQDARLMTTCGLIGKYGGYYRTDLETVRGLLQYEYLRQKAEERPPEDGSHPACCRLCGEPLPPEPEGKVGRPREYCRQCEALRARERQRKLRERRQRQRRRVKAAVY